MNVIFVFAHPDDESFSSGGTIKNLTDQGATVELITATRGEVGSVGNPPLCTQEELGKIRERELKKASKILAISQIYFLDFIDGKLKAIPIKVLTNKILTIFNKEKPDMVVTFNKEGGSRHPDHIQVSKAATTAFKQYMEGASKHIRLYHTSIPRKMLKIFDEKGLGYSAFGKIRGTPDNQITTRVNIKKTLKTKIRALKFHQTQHQDIDRFLKRMKTTDLSHEYFCLVSENGLI